MDRRITFDGRGSGGLRNIGTERGYARAMKPWHLAAAAAAMLPLIFLFSFVNRPFAQLVVVLLWPLCLLTFLAAGIFALVRSISKPRVEPQGWRPSTSVPIAPPDVAARLTQLAHLHTTGTLTDDEYAAAKQKAIAGD